MASNQSKPNMTIRHVRWLDNPLRAEYETYRHPANRTGEKRFWVVPNTSNFEFPEWLADKISQDEEANLAVWTTQIIDGGKLVYDWERVEPLSTSHYTTDPIEENKRKGGDEPTSKFQDLFE